MKKIMMIAALMVVAVTASAQRSPGDQTLKPFVGFNLANFAGDINDNSIKFAIAAGAEYERQLTDLIALSAGAVFSWQGCEFSGDASIANVQINIPVLANFYVIPKLALKVGLQPGFIVSSKYKVDKNTADQEHQTLELSIPFGLSYEFQKFVVDARYNLGLTKVNKGNGSIRNSVFQITLGYRLDL